MWCIDHVTGQHSASLHEDHPHQVRHQSGLRSGEDRHGVERVRGSVSLGASHREIRRVSVYQVNQNDV